MLILCRSGLIFLFSFSFSWSYLNIPVRTAIKPILIITSTEMWGMSIFYPLILLTSRKECTIRLRVHESHWKGSDRRKESRAGAHELNEKSKQKKSCLNNRTWCPSSPLTYYDITLPGLLFILKCYLVPVKMQADFKRNFCYACQAYMELNQCQHLTCSFNKYFVYFDYSAVNKSTVFSMFKSIPCCFA